MLKSVDAELPLGRGLPPPEAPADGELVPALEEADAPGDPDGVDEVALGDGEATGDGSAEGCGGGVGAGTGAGANARIPPKTSAPARMPAMRPATTDRRGDISAGGYQYERSRTCSDGPR